MAESALNYSASSSGGEGDDPNWGKIKNALADDRWDFRSVDGIATDSGLSADVVKEILERHRNEVRVSFVPDSKGRTLYTLATKRVEIREILASALAFVSKST